MRRTKCVSAIGGIVRVRYGTAVVGLALLLVAALSGVPRDAQAKPPAYTFTKIAKLGEATPLPGGGPFVNDFEPGGLNSQGDMAFGADVNVSGGGEGVFLKRHNAPTIELGRTGGSAPGGGIFEFGFLGTVGLNDQGDAVFDFLLKDFDTTKPFGYNAGSYRYSHTTGKVIPVVRPFITLVPGGGTFQGVSFVPTINNRGDIAFGGIVATDFGVHIVPQSIPPEPYIGLGIGVFRADAKGHIAQLVIPGDAAPGGGTFDYAVEPWINDGGDVSFIGHIAGEESVVEGFPPQAVTISALGGLYVKDGARGTIRTIVHAGDPVPGIGPFRQAFHDVMNNRGDVAFFGDVTPAPHSNENIGVFLSSGSKIITIARPGDAMPGGGNLLNGSLVGGNIHINNRGDVVFSGVLDTKDSNGFPDTGLFRSSHGQLNVIARADTVIPGVGTVFALISPSQLVIPPPPSFTTTSGAINNDAGQVLFVATMTNGECVLLLATPREE